MSNERTESHPQKHRRAISHEAREAQFIKGDRLDKFLDYLDENGAAAVATILRERYAQPGVERKMHPKHLDEAIVEARKETPWLDEKLGERKEEYAGHLAKELEVKAVEERREGFKRAEVLKNTRPKAAFERSAGSVQIS
jgi:hypothetical protein